MPRVGVVVLNWNGTADTVECLRSLRRLDYDAAQIILVDNGSRPPAAAELARQFPEIDCLQLPRNLGYAGGNNAGIRRALECGCDYVFVLNNDTVVDAGCVRAAVAMARADERVGVVGVRIISMDDCSRFWVAYGQVTYRQGLVRLIGYLQRDVGQFDTPRDVEWVPGTAMLLARRALEEVGLFDEEFFAYHEDVDWCVAARARGFRVVYAPAPVVYHKGHRSSGGKGYMTPRQYLAGRNMVLFVRKHGTIGQQAKFAFFVLATLPAQFIRRWITGEQRGVIMKLEGMLAGWRRQPVAAARLGLE